MKKILCTLFLTLLAVSVYAQQSSDTLRHEVLLETDSGNIRIRLYNETIIRKTKRSEKTKRSVPPRKTKRSFSRPLP